MAVESIQVQVQNDFLNKVSQATPTAAIAELVWNALDADATKIYINTKENELDAISEITINDNGHGIPHAHAPKLFGSLGGSWKSNSNTTGQGRFLHGQEGKGRFKAFALGNLVEWDITFFNGSSNDNFQVSSEFTQLNTFNISAPYTTDKKTGVTVRISNIHKSVMFLNEEALQDKLKVIFAFYMMAYKNVEIYFNGKAISTEGLIKNQQSYSLGSITDKDKKFSYELEVVEWNEKTERTCYLCNQHGFPLEKSDRSMSQLGDLYLTAYIKSEHTTLLNNAGLLAISEMDSNLASMLDLAWSKLKEYAQERIDKSTKDKLKDLHRDEAYPFDAPKNATQRILIQKFDNIVLNLQNELSDYPKLSVKSKKIHFQLLKLALEKDDAAVNEIIKNTL